MMKRDSKYMMVNLSMINIMETVYYIIKRKIKCILMAFLKIIRFLKENYMSL
jgi:hypothetical protein